MRVVPCLATFAVIGLASCNDAFPISDRCFRIPFRFAPADTTLAVGDTIRIRATLDTSGGCFTNLVAAPKLWLSADTTVATIDSITGLLTARAAGHTYVELQTIGVPYPGPNVTVTGP